jgi:UDP-N-acetylglucosamine 2-epimerase (non-hydrolysing)
MYERRNLKKILFIFGTRPEAVKIAPVVRRMRKSSKFRPILCSTGQHLEMLKPVLTFFEIRPDYNLDLMKPNQSLAELTSSMLAALDPVLGRVKADLVFVQGDTTTTMVGALSAFYRAIQIGHLEAGLRSHNKFSPYPEEANRILTSHLADHHFAPTKAARHNLILEGISSENIHLVGNTVVDALLWAQEKVHNVEHIDIPPELSDVDFSKKVILVTGHRRESFGQPFIDLCSAIKSIAEKESVEIIYPVHLNPNVVGPVHSVLNGVKNVHLIEPVTYPIMIYLMKKAYLILTDSGGIQEEAPSFKKPVLVMRDVTERPEGIECGIAKLVGTTRDKIYKETAKLLHNRIEYLKMTTDSNPYGDGKASERIIEVLERTLYGEIQS